MPYIIFDPSTATVIPEPTPNPAAPIATGLSLVEARTEIRAMLTGRSDVTDPRIDFWLNKAYIDIATSAKKLDELKASLSFDTVADQPLYLLPAITVTSMTLTRIDDDHPDGGVPVDKIDQAAYRRRKDLRALGVAIRKPQAFVRSNRILAIDPIPDGVYSLVMDYRFEPQPLVEDADCPILSSEWHEAWILLARKKILSALNEWEASLAAGNDFTTHARMRQDREVNEGENAVVRSSVPRTEQELRRRGGTSKTSMGS